MARQLSQRTTASGAAVRTRRQLAARTARCGSPRTGAAAASPRRCRRAPAPARRARSVRRAARRRGARAPAVRSATAASISARAASRRASSSRCSASTASCRCCAPASAAAASSARSITSSSSSSSVDWRRASVAISCCRLSSSLAGSPPACSRASSRLGAVADRLDVALQPPLLELDVGEPRSAHRPPRCAASAALLLVLGDGGELGQVSAAVVKLGQRGVGGLQVEQAQLDGGVGVHVLIGSLLGWTGTGRAASTDR